MGIGKIVVSITFSFFVIFLLCNILGVFPGRYQYIPTHETEMEIPFVYPDGKTETKYVTSEVEGIFDTWTGIEYRYDDITNMICTINFINNKVKLLGRVPTINMVKQSPGELKEMQDKIMRKLNREDEKKKEELIKAILPIAAERAK